MKKDIITSAKEIILVSLKIHEKRKNPPGIEEWLCESYSPYTVQIQMWLFAIQQEHKYFFRGGFNLLNKLIVNICLIVQP